MNPPYGHSGIYSIACVNGHRYVGSAVDLKKRWNQHRNALRRGTHHSRYMQRAWDKYGDGAFLFQVLFYCDKQDLILFEQRAIDVLRPEYNICRTAGSTVGYRASAATRAKLSALNKGKPRSAETCAKISASLKGRTFSPEWRAKLSDALRGHPGHRRPPGAIAKTADANRGNKYFSGHKHTDETKAKISELKTGLRCSPETRAKISASTTISRSTPEAKAKMSAAQKLRWSKGKAR